MVNKEDILTISELVTLYDAGKLEGNHFICYPTKRHREVDSRGYIPLTEVKAFSELRKQREKELIEILWKN